jgi:hypothetical protein
VAKKRISSIDLSWLISEKLVDQGSGAGISLAVVTDEKMAGGSSFPTEAEGIGRRR